MPSRGKPPNPEGFAPSRGPASSWCGSCAGIVGDAGAVNTFKSNEIPGKATLISANEYARANSFRYVYAYANTGDDAFKARDADPTAEDWARLRDAADAIYALWAHGFDAVTADSGTGDDDTANFGPNLDFTLDFIGTWEN